MDKTSIIAGVLVLLIIIVAAGYFLLVRGKSAPQYSTVTTVAPQYSTTMGQGYSTIPPTNSTISSNTMTGNTPASNTVAPASYAVNLESSGSVGSYLANESEFALYTFKADVAYSNVSACTGSCIANWPPFYVTNLTVAPGLNVSAFGTITRTGGAKQLTYTGWPLYLFVGDGQADQVNGNGVSDFVVAKP